MKKNVILCLLFLGISTYIKAQSFDAGFVCGIAATQVDGDTYAGYDKAGPIIGIWVGHRINTDFYTRVEFRYAQKGSFAKKVDEGVSSSYYRMRLNYFELPLIVGYRLRSGFNPIVGLSAGYLAKAKEMDQLGSFPSEDIQKFNKFEFAGLFGVEYNKSERWAFYLVFSYSFLPIRNQPTNPVNRWDKGQYNNVLELVARYKL